MCMRFFSLVLSGLFVWGISSCKPEPKTPSSAAEPARAAKFTLLSAEATGISFENRLEEGLNTNILMYEYFYNGGGVAAGDLNGDSLTDLYFTANMGPNQLYLNRGNLQFQAVPEAQGRPGPWKTGVTFVDINGDHKLDIYLCYSGALPDEKRKNQLFVNTGNDENGVPRFEEQAEAYGLASAGFSNQAYFFDADRDGDLDMLLLNHNPQSLPVLNEEKTLQLLREDDPLRGLRFLKQDNGQFKDVTRAAGISGTPLAYGLGLAISDVNGDGWADFYVSNDYTAPDYLYINNRNGTFTNRLAASMGHTSHFSMGNDAADINNDGLTDIFTLDMLPEDNRRQKLLLSPDNYDKFNLNLRSGLHYQYMRNMLQLNNGDGTFSEVGQLAGISNTDWSWAPLFADLDNDGWKDLYITNGYNRDYTNLDFINYMDDFTRQKGRLKREDVLELIQQMPASNVANYAFSNKGNGIFAPVSKEWGLGQMANSNGAAYADLDNDGDLDLIVNNVNQRAFVFRNESRNGPQTNFLTVVLEGADKNTLGIGARLEVKAGGNVQVYEQSPTRGYLSSVSPVLHVGLGSAPQADTLTLTWATGEKQTLTAVKANQRLVLRQADAEKGKSPSSPKPKPFFRSAPAPFAWEQPKTDINDFYRQGLLLSQLSYLGSCMAQGDLNGDGKEDLVIGGASGKAAGVYVQGANGRFSAVKVPDLERHAAHDDAAICLLDANGDGKTDIFIASGGYRLLQPGDSLLRHRLYLNEGNGRFSYQPGALPDLRSSAGAAVAFDANGDGLTDLFVGGRVVPGRWPETPLSYLLVNDGKGKFADKTAELAPELAKPGMVTAAVTGDLDGDGASELVIAGEWMPIRVFARTGGKWAEASSRYFDRAYSGFCWNTLRLTDVNGDGLPDLVAGNAGLNTQFRLSPDQPARLHADDFDNNGSIDPVFSYFIQGKSYPYVTRDELLKQLAGLRARYTTYESFSNATLEEIFAPEALNKAQKWTADHQATSLFLSRKGQTFVVADLPLQAQYAPVQAIAPLDANGDGHTDLLLCGNHHYAKLRLGRYDANYGVLLLGDGKGGFSYVPQTQSGLSLRGEIRSVVQVGNAFLFASTQGPLVSYQLQTP